MCQGKVVRISLQYIAGLFDGEGSIGIYRCHGGRYLLRTQLVQNMYPEAKKVFGWLMGHYGGNASPQPTLSNKTNFNWQLNAHIALVFLEDIYPYLNLKKQEAKLAILWQRKRPVPTRDPRTGWYVRYPADKVDKKVANLLKKLKQTKRTPKFKKGKS